MAATVDIHALVGAYALDAVDDIERAAFERHLRDCESCTAEVAELRETATWLAQPVAEPAPPRMRDAVLYRIHSTPQERPKAGATSSRPVRRSLMKTWIVGAAASVIFAGAASAGTYAITQQQFAQSASIDAVLAAADAQLVTKQMEGGIVTMVVSPSHDAGVAVLNGLRKPEGSYQLWMISDSTASTASYRSVAVTDSGSGRFYIKGLTPDFGLSREKKGGTKNATPTDVVGSLKLR
ncbi:anti-sigma factor domain-containing protein [Dactylosporangium sp. NPDC051541]|uniref:anti-sigma factor n=1 Tax=Dactylosporangium sp. NPDC051541 TaxID=3363977 RepID=UPI00379743E6